MESALSINYRPFKNETGAEFNEFKNNQCTGSYRQNTGTPHKQTQSEQGC
ncbi:hypothetical protein PITCH_A1280066 [uncultured Desulfobacterium sp.]|uniref:Uncharacterized protein n=1 Tax=uncultured Desulfobacterium sp. TaxID=201089 RepID=A0A445MS72_9BACT|nr:hypothetical protein PITCH_A1280066 [uncultured Desulfobacterium sp.]